MSALSLSRKADRIVATFVLGLVVYTLSLSLMGYVMSVVQTNRTLSNVGEVKAIGVGVYWDINCTNDVTSIDWGMVEPGSNKSFTCYIRNEGNSASTLSMYTSNWNPSNASEYMVLSWDYDGQAVNPGEVVEATFTLSVSASIEGITSFSFDIVIVGSG